MPRELRACCRTARLTSAARLREDMSVKFDQAGVYGVKYLPLLRNGHGGHHRGRHADKHRAGQGGAAGQQGQADVCEAVREHENPSSSSPSRGSPVCRSRAFATIKVPRRPTASAFFLRGLNLGRRVDPPVTGRIRGRPSPKCCSANWRQRLGVHTAVPNWTGRPPLESAGLHLARWMHRGILIGVDRMRGSLCDRRGMSRFPCDEDCRSRIGADLDDSIGQELMRGRMSASSATEDRLRERAVAA